MKCLLVVLLATALQTAAQQPAPVVAMDFVRVKQGRFAEALFFYQNNWKVYRDEALRRGYITGYRIVETKADSIAAFHLVLITEYADSVQQNNSENNFEGIIKALRPNGALLLNNLQPADFRQNLFYRLGKEVMASPQKR